MLDDGLVVRTETDSDRDGRMDRWQGWTAGHLTSEEVDTDRTASPTAGWCSAPRGKLLRMERLPR